MGRLIEARHTGVKLKTALVRLHGGVHVCVCLFLFIVLLMFSFGREWSVCCCACACAVGHAVFAKRELLGSLRLEIRPTVVAFLLPSSPRLAS